MKAILNILSNDGSISLRGRSSVLWGPDLQRAGFWRVRGVEGLQESPPFMTTRPSHNIINGFLKLTNKNSAAIGENLGERNIFACM